MCSDAGAADPAADGDIKTSAMRTLAILSAKSAIKPNSKLSFLSHLSISLTL